MSGLSIGKGAHVIETYRKLLDLLTPRERRKFYLLLVMIVVMGILQMLTVASILPLMFVLQHPAVIETNALLSRIYSALGFTSHQGFMLALASGVFVFVIFGMVFKAVTAYATYRFTMRRSYTISSRMLSGYLFQPYTWFLDRHSAALGAAVLGEVQKVVTTALLPAMKFLTGLVTSAALIALLLVVRPEVALVTAGDDRRGLCPALCRRATAHQSHGPGTSPAERAALPHRRRGFRRHEGREAPRARRATSSIASRARRGASPRYDAARPEPARSAALRDRGRRLRRARGLHPLPADHRGRIVRQRDTDSLGLRLHRHPPLSRPAAGLRLARPDALRHRHPRQAAQGLRGHGRRHARPGRRPERAPRRCT